MKEKYLLTGPLEPTNEPYATAKIAGIKMCENYYRQYGCNFYSVMPTNLYGPNDNFDLETSHVVLPALIRKFHEAKINNKNKVTIWGTGNPSREFLYVDDLADAIFFLLDIINSKDIYNRDISHLNIGTGQDLTIFNLARIIMSIVGYRGNIIFDSSKPDGVIKKLLNVDIMLDLGWKPKIEMQKGIKETYNWYKKIVLNKE